MKLLNISKKEAVSVLSIIFIFIAVAYLADRYSLYLESIIGVGNIWGMIAYVALTVLAIVFVPISAFPLIPIAASLWGPLLAAFLSIIGWTIGGAVAFWLASSYGRPFVEKVANVDKVEGITNAAIGERPFWTIVLLRMIIPVDILSYALGLFADVSFRTYVLATFIGVSPFAFVFAYTSILPIEYQLFVLVIISILIVSIYYRIKKKITKTS